VGPGLLLALTLPGLVLLLVGLAVAEAAWARTGRRSAVTGRARHALSAGGLDVLSAAMAPGRALDLDERRHREVLRDDVEDGAPPRSRVDLDAGVAHLVLDADRVPSGRRSRRAPAGPARGRSSGRAGDTGGPAVRAAAGP
jgi:hypothetical protein